MSLSHAIVRPPSSALTRALTTEKLGTPDVYRALQQHARYVDALALCGLEVWVLDPAEELPDATFIEDVAVIFGDLVIITRPGAEERRREVELTASLLHQRFTHFKQIEAPGTLDGGDVLATEDTVYIGLSDRTNRQGAEQLARILQDIGREVELVDVTAGLHLKSGLSSLSDHRLLAAPSYVELPVFKSEEIIPVPAHESYAANVMEVNEYVLIPEGYPATHKLLADHGYRLLEIPMSEFRKADGGLTCLSLRY